MVVTCDILRDRANVFVNLINCVILDDCVKCSIAYFLGGISGDIELISEKGDTIKVRIPDYVLESATFCLRVNELEKVKLERLVQV